MQKQKHEMESKRSSSEKELQQRLSQEESTIDALRQESNVKDKHLAKLRASVKEVSVGTGKVDVDGESGCYGG